MHVKICLEEKRKTSSSSCRSTGKQKKTEDEAFEEPIPRDSCVALDFSDDSMRCYLCDKLGCKHPRQYGYDTLKENGV